MPYDEIYQSVIADFKKTGSVKKTAQNVGTTLVRAQRILITEGLWSSATSEKVAALYSRGQKVSEIAAELFVSQKTVQAYLPYSRSEKGYGGDNRSDDAIKSEDYRTRMHQAAESQVSSADMEKERKEMVKEMKKMKTNEELGKTNSAHIPESQSWKGRTMKDNGLAEENKASSDKMTAEELYSKHMKRKPEVLGLQLSLDLQDVDDGEMEVLRKYGKVKNGISREILVPADITLHALNYVILRSFGWQNSHLHQFRFPNQVFQKLTKGKNRDCEERYFLQDGLYTDWAKLCGIYFRFPCDDFDDLYWDDDYEEWQSIKTWLARKYTGPYSYGGTCEHYYFANQMAQSVIENNPENKKATIHDIQYSFNQMLDEVLERIPLIELITPEGINEDKGMMDKIAFLQKRQENEEDDIPVIPVTDELIYAYDFGDGWEVSIRLKDCYYTQAEDGPDSTISDAALSSATSTDAIFASAASEAATLPANTSYDMKNHAVDEDLALKIATVVLKRRPTCLAMDGIPLVDDVGGIGGFVDFLEKIHDNDSYEKEELKEWAKGMGWTGHMSKPENLL